jgi:hypothetical protein
MGVAVGESVEEQRPGASDAHAPGNQPRYPWHPLIRDHDGDLFVAVTQPFQNGQTALGRAFRDDPIVGAKSPVQRFLQRGHDVAIVVDHEERRPGYPAHDTCTFLCPSCTPASPASWVESSASKPLSPHLPAGEVHVDHSVGNFRGYASGRWENGPGWHAHCGGIGVRVVEGMHCLIGFGGKLRIGA